MRFSIFFASCWGSSPRMRGAQHHQGPRRQPAGIIPAYAGSTTTRTYSHMPPRDHPRVCGERFASRFANSTQAGSSPRMRGALTATGPNADNSGIIPAYAGSTPRSCSRCGAFRDHPRVCGEHSCRWRVLRAVWGSSPRMRGAPMVTPSVKFTEGIIPAYAGSTIPFSNHGRSGGDHPRVCGEHASVIPLMKPVTGSSPRMRGAPSLVR